MTTTEQRCRVTQITRGGVTVYTEDGSRVRVPADRIVRVRCEWVEIKAGAVVGTWDGEFLTFVGVG